MLFSRCSKHVLNRCFLLFIFITTLGVCDAQTIGGTFGIFSNSSGNQLIQTVGQPYTNIFRQQNSKSVLFQGQILPSYFQTLRAKSDKSSFQIYPNPANDFLHVLASGNLSIRKVEILDVQSKKISVHADIISGNLQRIMITGLSEGIYFLRVTDEFGNVDGFKFTKINK